MGNSFHQNVAWTSAKAGPWPSTKHKWTAAAVEFQLEPAWKVCAQELCMVAASHGGAPSCYISEARRNQLRYGPPAKRPLAWLDTFKDITGGASHFYDQF